MKRQFSSLTNFISRLLSRLENLTPLTLFLGLVLLKLTAAHFLPLVGDETYYWFWGQNLQLSYFDHPAAVALLSHVSQWLSILPQELRLRWPFLILSLATTLVWLKLLQRDRATSKSQAFFLTLVLLNPLLGVGGVFATPDAAFLFFWALAFFLTQKILESHRLHNYALLGAVLGLGFCSKYHMALFPLVFLLSLAVAKKIRLIQWSKLVLTAFCGIIFSSPVIVWNIQNDFQSFRFQMNHGFSGGSYNAWWTISYVLGQALLFGPPLLWALLQRKNHQLTTTSALANWAFFLISSFRAGTEANWPVASHYTALAHKNLNSLTRAFRWTVLYFSVLWVILLVLPQTDFGQEKLVRLPQSMAAREILASTSLVMNESLPLYGPSYQMSSLLHYISGRPIYKLPGISRFDFYDQASVNSTPSESFYVLKYDISDWPAWLISRKVTKLLDLSKYQLGLYRVENE
jgi:Dolichyl-phosphate-mannose-protein mannosyltransferase